MQASGHLNYIFGVTATASGPPAIHIVTSDADFPSIKVEVTADSGDWAYQYLLPVFKGTINNAVNSGLIQQLNSLVGIANGFISGLPNMAVANVSPLGPWLKLGLNWASWVLFGSWTDLVNGVSNVL